MNIATSVKLREPLLKGPFGRALDGIELAGSHRTQRWAGGTCADRSISGKRITEVGWPAAVLLTALEESNEEG